MRTVADVMTRVVVTAGPGSTFKEMLARMGEFRVSALPVLDDVGRLVGIVSEDDLLVKEEYSGAGRGPGRLHPRMRRKAAGQTAADVMTREVVTASPGMTLPEAARRLRDHHVKRLPVVDDEGRVTGIVSRADLLRVFLRPDEAIRDEIETEVLDRTFWLGPRDVQVAVTGGVVTLRGRVERRDMIPLIVRFAERVDGVVGVDAEAVAFDFDDRHISIRSPMLSDVT